MPVLCNLFGTANRVAMGMGQEDISALREVGKLLAFLKEPEPPKGFRDLFDKMPKFKQVLNMPTKVLGSAPCQEQVWQGEDVDLGRIPVMHCWPEDAAPLITWGLTVTRGPHKERQNLGIYRQQVLGKNKVIMRWLSHRGGALDYQEWCQAHPGERFPVAVALGPILPPSSVRSRRCRIPCLNMPLPGCCAAIKPKWSSAFPTIWKCPPAPKSCWKAISSRVKWRRKALRRPHRLLQ